MSSVTTTAETTTLYHNSGIPEEELSQMLLLFIVGIVAALLSVCIAKWTTYCHKQHKRRAMKKEELLNKSEARKADIDNDIAQWDEPGMKERRLARISSTSKDGYSPEVPQIIEIGNIMTPYESTPVEAINSTDGGLDEPNAAGKAAEDHSSKPISRGEDIPYGLIANMIMKSHSQWRKKETQRILMDSMITKLSKASAEIKSNEN